MKTLIFAMIIFLGEVLFPGLCYKLIREDILTSVAEFNGAQNNKAGEARIDIDIMTATLCDE